MTNTTISKTFFFAAPRETVWAFLTEKEKLSQWFNTATTDLIEGEEYSLVRKTDDDSEVKLCWGKVLEMEKPSRLVYSFTVDPLNGAMTTVTWTLEEIDGGTRLSLVHEGIAEAVGEGAIGLLLGLDKGWEEHIDTLRSLVNPTMESDCDG